MEPQILRRTEVERQARLSKATLYRMSPTTELRQAMARYSLDPHGDIIWDGEFHRFKTEHSPHKKNGFYKAFPDRKGAVFGEWGRTENVNWQSEHREKADDATRKMWKLEREEREKKKVEKRAAAEVQLRKRWQNASPDVQEHPYFVAKKIKRAWGLKVDGEELLVPMRDAVGVLQNIQRIKPDGQKRTTKYADAIGCRMVIGRAAHVSNPDRPIYVVEGWAKGWAVHTAADAMVIVAFNTEGLLPVARDIQERHPKAKLVIAGDNDRWSAIERGLDKIPNPGAWYARTAAEELGIDFALPDFKDLTDKPTDFHDLWAAEGKAAVARWLDPSRNARIVLEGEDGEVPEPEPEEEGAEDWVSTAPFRCLGSLDGTYYYLPRNTGEIKSLPASAHTQPSRMLTLAPYGWWDDHFSDNPRGWRLAADALMRRCHEQGMFQPGRLRGRGMWRNDDGRVVMHLGDRLLPPDSKSYVKPEEYYEEGRIYARLPRLPGPDTKHALNLSDARKLYGVFDGLLWQEEAAGMLLAGWTVLAPFSGALPWRPHVWLAGGTGSGKTTVLARIVEPLLGGMGRMVEGGSTEAGIRQTLKADALPVLYDAAERTGKKADSQVQAVLRLARSASSTTSGETLKGTVGGKAMAFDIRSMFCLASIGGVLRQEADKSRVALLQLRSNHAVAPEKRQEHWAEMQPQLQLITPALGRRLVARTARWFLSGAFDELLAVARSAATVVLGDARSGDQYGTLGAGAWTLLHDDIPDEEEMREWFKDLGIASFIEELAPEGERILSILLQAREIVQAKDGARKVAVGEMVGVAAAVAGETIETAAITKEKADGYLRQMGLRVRLPFLYIANKSEWVRKKLADTAFANGWRVGLRTMPDVGQGGMVHFYPGCKSRTTKIPLEFLNLKPRT